MLNIALAKGRLGNQVYDLFEKIGYNCTDMREDNRRLIFENPACGACYFLVKPTDVSTYVERGVADVGVTGKDVLLEQQPNVYELLDLGIGKCHMAVAAKNGYAEDVGSVLRVATKYPNITRNYYKGINREIEIIKLSGSIELAPILGLSDVIMDIVQTGNTLRENDLSVCTMVLDISARLIANKASYRFKQAEIARLVAKLTEAIR